MTEPDEQFKEQGGTATMDPSKLRRWVISKLMTSQATEKRMLKARSKVEARRIKKKQPHVVEYFHQLDDAYSHLAAQALKPLVERYDIKLVCHVASAPAGANSAEPDMLQKLGVNDARAIAPHYKLAFPNSYSLPTSNDMSLALRILAGMDSDEVINHLAQISTALWESNTSRLTKYKYVDEDLADQFLASGNACRAKLKHYSGAMFYYGGEWYWGVDRLYHLEQRLRSLGADKTPDVPDLISRPEIAVEKTDSGNLTLEIFASLRSPYTAIAYDRAIQLAKDSGINYVIRPVYPMVMRGVPITLEKGLYILFDTAREARAAGVPYGNVYDPIGQPARNGYALYDWAKKFNLGNELISIFLRAAFVEGVNTNKEQGLRYVIEQTGLKWSEAKQHLDNTEWQRELESNRLDMYASGLWGVPSFRLLDQQGNEVMATWGQDRLWLVSREIQRLLKSSHSS